MVSSQLPQNAAFSYDITCRVSVKSIVSAIRFDDVISFILFGNDSKNMNEQLYFEAEGLHTYHI